jgi:hypothetical protein
VASKEKGAAFTSYQASGDLADPMDILRANGIHLGQDVRRQDADTLYKIVQMSGGFLKMKPESQIKLVSVTINEFVEKWQVAKQRRCRAKSSACMFDIVHMIAHVSFASRYPLLLAHMLILKCVGWALGSLV